MKRILALDIGDRRIGVAVSDIFRMIAQPVETFTRVGYGPDVRHIAELAKRFETDEILCGLPVNMDGTEGIQAQKTKDLAKIIIQAGFKVFFMDERLTSVEADDILLQGRLTRKDRKKNIDKIAAALILESYLNNSKIK